MINPEISVVMGVFNAENTVGRTIDSILQQTDISFEFIIINDGSSDNSQKIIESYCQSDSRIKLINQENQGLTRALINGCDCAQGQFIARQDAGDISYEGRLSRQFQALKERPKSSLISCATRFETPCGERLYTTSQTTEQAQKGLRASCIERLKGPSHHGSTMFPRERYNSVGGYREEFKVAQDLDLWTRLAEAGDVISLEQAYYCATVEKNSITINKRNQQVLTSEYILRAGLQRATVGNDRQVLIELGESDFESKQAAISQPHSDAAYYYFLGSNLLQSNTQASLKYLSKAIRLTPFNWKIIVKITFAQLTLLIHRAKLWF